MNTKTDIETFTNMAENAVGTLVLVGIVDEKNFSQAVEILTEELLAHNVASMLPMMMASLVGTTHLKVDIQVMLMDAVVKHNLFLLHSPQTCPASNRHYP